MLNVTSSVKFNKYVRNTMHIYVTFKTMVDKQRIDELLLSLHMKTRKGSLWSVWTKAAEEGRQLCFGSPTHHVLWFLTWTPPYSNPIQSCQMSYIIWHLSYGTNMSLTGNLTVHSVKQLRLSPDYLRRVFNMLPNLPLQKKERNNLTENHCHCCRKTTVQS